MNLSNPHSLHMEIRSEEDLKAIIKKCAEEAREEAKQNTLWAKFIALFKKGKS